MSQNKALEALERQQETLDLALSKITAWLEASLTDREGRKLTFAAALAELNKARAELARLREDLARKNLTFRLPAPLVIGKNPVIQAFGRRHDEAAGVSVTAEQVGGKIVDARVIVGRQQLELFHPDLADMESPNAGELISLVGRLLTPRDLRVFMACFAAAEEDGAPAGVRGAFFYSPTRFADMLGFTRQANKAKGGRRTGTRQTDKARDEMDERLAGLGNVKLKATVMLAKQSRTITAEKLVFDAHASFTEEEEVATGRRKGRRKVRLYQLNPALLMMLDRAEGGWFFNLPVSALAPPEGADQRLWDGAFKLALLLYGTARTNCRAAEGEAALPWQRDLPSLLEAGNLFAKGNRSKQERRAYAVKLLDLAAAAGLVRYELEGETVRFDLPPERRQELAGIPEKRAELPPAKRRRRKGKAPK